ncbi:Smc5-6 complex non-SMC subunit Nse3 [Schizosaccharomyces cryophilus OY26]|uniref:Smc5-6 complex non-SMC subunit Nse3 n=1 Tax=Schizosaccharomyces cryophilus (strain OY26 / ATCC MYA-4695 / CBS 11777 / NBRC 106824 / NRRL Y48691) TaxID=653667 RepID=S9XA26_SCHCR|nr:Smc5-6 complex non-SMC subunit Nse3 [Schizosaccharomyces cryophilus OY26]EPY50611.1 Smc5-6 complex non-SMC subunit Nse3 [Schizosaccharomyces cryophilus OY26]
MTQLDDLHRKRARNVEPSSSHGTRLTASQIIADEEEGSEGEQYIDDDLESPNEDAEFEQRSGRVSSDRSRRKKSKQSVGTKPLDGLEKDETDSMNFQMLVRNIVRLAICSQSSHQALSRKEVIQRAFLQGSSRSLFQPALEEANHQLQSVFGFQLVQVSPTNRRKEMAISQLRKQHASNASSSSNIPKYWILKSSLRPEYSNDQRLVPDSLGDTSFLGFLMLVVSLVAVSHGFLGEMELKSYLENLLSSEITPFQLDLDRSLNLLVRFGYLDRVKDDTHNQSVYYVGSRSEVEIGKQGLKSFISEFVQGTNLDEVLPDFTSERSESLSNVTENDD